MKVTGMTKLYKQEQKALEITASARNAFSELEANNLTSALVRAFPHIKQNYALRNFANFKVGGAAKLFYEVHQEAELSALRAYIAAFVPTLPQLFMGRACNMVISDAGVSALLIYTGEKFSKVAVAPDHDSWDPSYVEEVNRKLLLKSEAEGISFSAGVSATDGAATAETIGERRAFSTAEELGSEIEKYVLVHVQAGKELKSLVKEMAAAGYGGLEFACGIPGSVGGATFMNAGAYGGQIADCLVGVRYMDAAGKICELRPSQVKHTYRSSYFMQDEMHDALILTVTFLLKKADPAELSAEIDALTAKRESSQPLDYPSAGSVFKRPQGYFAGKLISDAGFKGVAVGGAEVAVKHAGFIINKSFNCRSRDITLLIHKIQQCIFDLHDIELETEVRYIGDFELEDFVSSADRA